MMRILRRIFRRADPAPPILISVDDACQPVLQIERTLQHARKTCAPIEIRLTRNAYARLCEELGVEHLSQVCGLPIRVVGSAQA